MKQYRWISALTMLTAAEVGVAHVRTTMPQQGGDPDGIVDTVFLEIDLPTIDADGAPPCGAAPSRPAGRCAGTRGPSP
jgi:hypothetical protein